MATTRPPAPEPPYDTPLHDWLLGLTEAQARTQADTALAWLPRATFCHRCATRPQRTKRRRVVAAACAWPPEQVHQVPDTPPAPPRERAHLCADCLAAMARDHEATAEIKRSSERYAAEMNAARQRQLAEAVAARERAQAAATLATEAVPHG